MEMIAADVPWRPVLADGTGLLLNPRRTAFGSQTATVVGPDGQATPNGANEIYTDALGRIRIRFHWQEDSQDGAEAASTSTAWVRVLQRSAGGGSGAGRGLQFIPRIGQEVLVQFIEGDIDRPIVTAALYNGQGEGGVAPTPAGDTSTQADTSVFDAAHDHRYSAQGNLIGTGSGGHSPVWHGAGANSHRNPSAQWGIRSKEFGSASGSAGYNQLVFDDTDSQGHYQGRIQLKTTQNATELNLGHLIHTADNYRGSLRGTGAELRTDAYGAIRAGAGLLISSYQIQHSASSRDPAGDNSAGMALLKQASTLAGAFSQAASTHRTVAYASHIGAANANASSLDAQAAPLKALQTSASGMLNPRSLEQALADAAAKQTSTAAGPDGAPVPHSTDALIHIAARGGLGTVAGQSLQLSNGETLSLMSGQDSQYSTGGALRVHSGQAIGILAGAVQAGANGTGLQIIAAQDDIDIQAQSDTLQVQAKDQIQVQSANAHIDWAAAKKISISTAGGANITIEGGNITTQAPGQITVHASAKVFEGPGNVGYPMPQMPRSSLPDIPAKFNMLLMDVPGPSGVALANSDWRIVHARGADEAWMTDKNLLNGTSDATGKMSLSGAQEIELKKAYDENPNNLWVVYENQVRALALTQASEDWTNQQKTNAALDAMGYSDNLGEANGDAVDDFHSPLAKIENKTRVANKLLDKIKGA